MGFSVVTLLFNIGDVCNVLFWRIFFFTISAVLFAFGIFILCNKAIPNKIAGIVIFISILIAGAVWYHYKQYVDNSRRNELWREDLRINQDKSANMSDLEKSAILDNDARSQYHLAKNYLYARENYDYDFGKAKDFAQKAADQGNPKAHALLAVIYTKGYGFEPNHPQAFSNIVLSIKGGYEQSLSLLSLLDSSSFQVSSKDSLILHECIQNRAYLDSLYDVLLDAYSKKQDDFHIVQAHKVRCQPLSDAGYYRATELLYYDALLDSTQSQQLPKYAQKLQEYDKIPDRPTMRTFFFKAIRGEMEASSRPDDDKEIVERSISDQDFWYSIILDDFDKRFIQDQFYRYEYDLAFYQRSKYLLANKDNLNTIFFELDDDLDQMYAIARKSLSDCTKELREEMINRPFLFGKSRDK